MRINDLDAKQREVLDMLFWLDENSQEDAEEVERLNKELIKLRVSAVQTLEFLAKILLESKAILEGREEMKRRAERRRKTAESAVIRLTSIIERVMKRYEIKKIDLDECSLRFQTTPGALVYADGFDVTELPEDCYRVSATPIASAISARIKDGEHFEGVELVKRDTLRVG